MLGMGSESLSSNYTRLCWNIFAKPGGTMVMELAVRPLSLICVYVLIPNLARLAIGIVQSAGSMVDTYIDKISKEQDTVDAWARLVDGQRGFGPFIPYPINHSLLQNKHFEELTSFRLWLLLPAMQPC